MKQGNLETFGGCALAGVSYGLSFPPFGLTGFAFIAPAWMLLTISRTSGRRAFLLALTFWLAAWGLAFGWVVGHRLWIAGVVSGTALVALAGLAAAASLGFGFFSTPSGVVATSLPTNGSAAPRTVMSRRPDLQTRRILAGVAGLMWMELLLLHGPVPMPWVMSGFTQAGSIWTSFLTAAIGTTGMGFLVMGTAATLAILARKRPLWVWPVALAAAILLSTAPSPLLLTSPGGNLTVQMEQPGLDAHEWADVENPDRNRRVLSLLDSVHVGLDLIVLPETALSGESLLRQNVQEIGVPVLAGAILEENGTGPGSGSEGAPSNRTFYNSALLAAPDTPTSRYDKRVMVPFAEHTPLSTVLPFLEQVHVPAGGVRSYAAGSRNDPMTVSGVRIQPLICFESLFPRLVDPGADVIVVLTQDGWWNSRAAREQHFLYSRLLAIQTGKPLIQASVDGISGAFDARGRLLAMSRQGSSDRLIATIPTAGRDTLYRVYTDWPVATFTILLTVFLFLIRHDS